MREIKFRAWDKVWKTFDEDLTFAIGRISKNIDNERFELMQFTGLKDKNGRDIYEGDILRHEYNIRTSQGVKLEETGIQIGEVIFLEDSMAFMIRGFNKHDVFWQKKWGEVEVIGNIYENPELFTNQKELSEVEG